LIVFIITALIGATDELQQYFIPEKTSSFADFAADLPE
jgi:VanZ family protein